MEFDVGISCLLTRVQQVVSQKYKVILSDYALTPVQYITLKCLWEFGSLSPGQLAEATFTDRSSMTGVLDKLENQGYVKRVPDPYDRRSIKICLTESGEELKHNVMDVVANVQADIRNGIRQRDPSVTDAEISIFYKLLNIVSDLPPS